MVRQFTGLSVALIGCSGPSSSTATLEANKAEPASFFLQNTQSPHQFKSEDGSLLRHEVGSGILVGQDKSRLTLEKWSNWGLLGDCVGHPLHPYLADPESLLVWIDSEPAKWAVHYSGLNPCSLSGTVFLDTHRDRVDVAQLRASGSLWAEEGRLRTVALLRIQYRTEAVTRYRGGDAPSRILLLKKLTEDPGGRAALQELLTHFPEDKDDLDRSILRHDSLFSQKASEQTPGPFLTE